MLDSVKIQKNYHIFTSLCKKVGDHRVDALQALIDHFESQDDGLRIAMTPASSRTKYHCAFPGGLVDHSLRVFANARRLNEAYDANIPIESLIIATLFHDFGKVGDLAEPFYLDQKSDWHRERGMIYTINQKCTQMPNAERGLWMLQHFGVRLTSDEWIAIRVNDGPGVDENKPYQMNEPTLAIIVHHADRMACQQEKDLYPDTCA